MTERRLIEICTFPAADAMIIDDLAALIVAAEAKAAAETAQEATKPRPAAPPTQSRRLIALIGAKASGWF
jgi:hypothetical protein